MAGTRRLIGATLAATLITSGISAQAKPTPPATPTAVAAPLAVITAIRDLTPREHRVQGFILGKPDTITIDAVGAEPRPGNGSGGAWPAAAWIVDVATRRVVWDLRTARTVAEANGLHRFEGRIAFPAGTYELHYGSYPANSVSFGSGNILQNIKTIINKAKHDNAYQYDGPYISDGLYHQFGITLRGTGRVADFRELASARWGDVAMVAMVHPVRHDAVERTAFSLGRPAALEVIATGEMTSGDASDIGWIINADSRQEVWRMSWAKTAAVGGSPRNRVEHVTLRLPAGRYVAYFTTNDSYDPSEWTRMPPLDPGSWGLVLRLPDSSARSAFKPIEWQPVPASGTLASISKVGDDESKQAEFVLQKPANVQLHALGEASGNEMADYAWLVDLDQHRRVWTMKQPATTPAGGATKNREFDGVLALPAGHYQLNYVSDGSHAFGDWNAAAPVEPEGWGVSAWVPTGPVDPATVIPVVSTAKLKPLAAIHHAGDNLNVEVGFHLDADAKVAIYAIGEGAGGGMQDYATIENATTHRSVWTMRYSATDAAGGADKNRQFDGTIDLKAGRYVLRWRSDGSHSWSRWNDDAPDNPEGWGVTVAKVP